MSFEDFLTKIPGWYWWLTIIFSVYYAYRDVLEHKTGKCKDANDLKMHEKIIIFYIQGVLFKVIITISSFLALFLAKYIFSSLTSFSEISAGTGVLLVFLFLWGIIGACGYLTLFISRGKVPGHN
jgi:hypothetical protein